MRSAVDLNIRLTKSHYVNELIVGASRLGFKGIALSCASVEPKLLRALVRDVGKQHGIDIAIRCDIQGRNPGEVKRALRELRRAYDVVCVSPLNREVARLAARDSRVDLILFTPRLALKMFDKTQAKMMADNGVAVEIPFNLYLNVKSLELGLRALINIVRLSTRYGCMIVVSSYASKPSELRSPIELSSLIPAVGGGEELGVLSVSKYPSIILRRRT